MKINLDDSYIRALATNSSVYQRGQLYFLQKRVSDLEFDREHNTINAMVEGEDDYSVVVEFDAEGEVDYHYCDCIAHSTYNGACKHVIAVLFAAQKKNFTPSKPSINKKNNSDLISYYEYINSSSSLDIVKLDVIVTLERYYTKLLPAMELRLGTYKTYVVKSMADFIEKLISHSSIEFGKSFTFSPAKHVFSDEDKLIIELLKELYEHEKLQKTLSAYGYSSHPTSFRGKKIYLSSSTFKRLMQLLENKSFSLIIGNEEIQNTSIIKEDLPLQLNLKKQGNDLKLSLQANTLPVQITEDGQYSIYNSMVYKASEKQIKYLAPIFNKYLSDKSDLVFRGDESSRFVSSVLPYLKKVSNINVDAAVEKSIHQAELLTKVFLDKEGNDITAHVEFHYDEYKINPLTSKDVEVQDSKILVRDMEGERNVLTHFEKDNFKTRNGVAYLDNEDDIYDFLIFTLPRLQSIAEVYYSESFKKINIKDSRAFSGGIRLNADTNMLEFSFHHDEIAVDELIDILSSLRLKKKYFRLKDGSFVPLDDGNLQSVGELIESLEISKADLEKVIIELPKYRAMYLDNQLKQLSLKHIERSQLFKQLVQNINEPQDMEYILPDTVGSIMREYQKTGYKWLKTLSSYNMGGILADDMGLGKTLQTISFILSNKGSSTFPSLVVAPTSLVYNWQDEIKKFAPELKSIIVSGTSNQRMELMQDINSTDIVITSYPLIRRDIELYKDLEFDYCFIDEAQHIKNPDSINAKSVKQIKAKGYFALTGTPIENSLTELWSIFDFVMPGYLLSHRRFVEKYEKPIIRNSDKKALEQIKSQIQPFILRRLKKDVLKELPEKIETRMIAELSEDQKKVYLAYLQQARSEIAQELKLNGFEKSHIKILSILTRLRQICCHPAMFLEDYTGGSGKMELLEELLEEALDGGHRILIFSQFTSMLKIIQNWMHTQNIEHKYLDGKTPVQQRSELVKAFNAGEGKAFLISLKAGGTGLNLTGADTVIHFDPWWNPAVEDQATDRAHRIGQKNSVQVFKLITKGTIEEKVYALQQKKKGLIEALVQPGETFITKLSEEEVKALFDI